MYHCNTISGRIFVQEGTGDASTSRGRLEFVSNCICNEKVQYRAARMRFSGINTGGEGALWDFPPLTCFHSTEVCHKN